MGDSAHWQPRGVPTTVIEGEWKMRHWSETYRPTREGEPQRSWRALEQIEKVLTDHGEPITYPLADAVMNVCAGRDEAVEALRGLLDVTDHRSMNEQAAGGDYCSCDACNVARYALRGQ